MIEANTSVLLGEMLVEKVQILPESKEFLWVAQRGWIENRHGVGLRGSGAHQPNQHLDATTRFSSAQPYCPAFGPGLIGKFQQTVHFLARNFRFFLCFERKSVNVT